MPVSLFSRMSTAGDMAAGTYGAILDHGLSAPAQRAIAEKCRISPATLSRRLQRRPMDELVAMIVDARDRTFPATVLPSRSDWLPADEEELADARVWSACQQLALHSPRVAQAVNVAWQRQRDRLALQMSPSLVPCDPTGSRSLDVLHALVEGLTARLLLDPTFDHAQAVGLFTHAIEAFAEPSDRTSHTP